MILYNVKCSLANLLSLDIFNLIYLSGYLLEVLYPVIGLHLIKENYTRSLNVMKLSFFKIKNIYLIILIAIEVIIAFIYYNKLSSRPDFFIEVPVSEAYSELGTVYEDGFHFDYDKGELVTSRDTLYPLNLKMEIPKGAYKFTLRYRALAASKVGLYSPSDPDAIECDEIGLSHVYNEVSVNMMVIRDVKDADLYFKYCGFQDFTIEGAQIESSDHDIRPRLILFIFICFMADLLAFLLINKRIYTSEHFIPVAVCVISALIASIPLFSNYLPLVDDYGFSYLKIEGIKDGILDKQFPVRLHPYTNLEFGYAPSYFYPDLFVYIPGLLRLAGFSLMDSFKFFMLFVNLATGLIAYYSLFRVFRDRLWATLGSILYMFSIYRIFDVYRRGAMGEYLAMVFLPLIIAGMYEILCIDKEGKREKDFKTSYALLAAGMSALIYSHVLSVEMMGIFLVLLCIFMVRRVIDPDRLKMLLKAAVWTLLLTAGFLLPFIDMIGRDVYKVFTDAPYSVTANALHPSNFLSYFIIPASEYNPTINFSGDFSYGIVLLLAIPVYIIIYFLKLRAGKDGSDKDRKMTDKDIKGSDKEISDNKILSEERIGADPYFVFVCALLALIALFLSSSIFPWSKIENSEGILKTVLCMVQFPWRYLSVATAFGIFPVCGIIAFISYELKRRELWETKKLLLYGLVIAITALTLIPVLVYFSKIPSLVVHQRFYDSYGVRDFKGTGMGEYEPTTFRHVDVDHTLEELQSIMDPEGYAEHEADGTLLSVQNFERSGTKLSMVVINTAPEERILYLPRLYYYGYSVSNVFESEDGLEPELFETDMGIVGLKIPAGYFNGVHMEYKEPMVYRIPELISLITLFAFGFVLIRSHGST